MPNEQLLMTHVPTSGSAGLVVGRQLLGEVPLPFCRIITHRCGAKILVYIRLNDKLKLRLLSVCLYDKC